MGNKKKKKVLIALDYDPSAERVAEAGFSLAKAMEADVILLHVIADPLYYSLSGHVTVMGFAGEKVSESNKLKSADGPLKVSEHFLEGIKKQLGDNSIQIIVKEGNSAAAIVKTAKDLQSEAIIMGSHSKRWLENIIMGSVTQEVIHLSTLPVIIIPTKKQN